MKNFFLLPIVCFSLMLASTLYAKGASGGGGGGGGGHAIGLGIGLMTASQDDFDSQAATVNALGHNAVKPGSGYEFTGFYEYRFSGTMFALHIQPSYVTQEGKGTTDTTTLTGYTLFPIARMYPLENSFIHFYMQAGLGYGTLSGHVSQLGGGSVDFSGSAFGALGGLGADFCFTPSHCMYFEGNFRYLPIQRNLVSSSSVTLAQSGFSQAAPGQELEFNGHDMATTMSGIIGSIGYHLNF